MFKKKRVNVRGQEVTHVKNLARTAVIAALTCLAGMLLHWISPALIPFSILPMMVFLAGIILGAEYGALAMLVYILIGLFGLPVFSKPPYAGLGYVLQPSFGFLIGYVAGAYVTGKIYKQGSLIRAFIGVLAGTCALYVFGLTYLYAVLRWVMHKPQDLAGVLAIGFLPFIFSDLIKAGLAAIIGNLVRKRRWAMDRSADKE